MATLMPSVLRGSAGHVTYVVLTFVPTISRTKLWNKAMYANEPQAPKKYLHSHKIFFTFYVSFTHLNIWISDPLDMPVPDLLVPYLQRLAPYAVQDGQEPGLEGVLEHVRSQTELLFRDVSLFPLGIRRIDQTGENRQAGTRKEFARPFTCCRPCSHTP